ncbi:MAG: 30S ribosomal protein S12 methylthiotransferase RimO [Planctomycetota bacterium]
MRSSKAPKVALVSLGCPKNLIDSEKILADLAEGGCVVAAPMDEADVIVVNTCGFLAAARQESLEVIAEALEQKRRGRARRVVVAGCLVEREAGRLYALAGGIDAVVGVNSRRDILAAVTGRGRVTKIAQCAGEINCDAGRFRLTPRHTAYLRISEGCSRKCSFCTIPAIRGPFRSKPPADVIAEARELIADGAVELNVIGQDTTAYGSDFARKDVHLAALLRRLDRLEGVEWIRLMYAYPKRFTGDLVDALADCEHVLPYVDLPLQHVNDRILRRMGRGMSRRGIEKLLSRLRARVVGLVLRTTLIVGFPGETDAEFEELLSFVKDFKFEAMGVFEFSAETGTRAAAMKKQVPDDVKAVRAEKLMLAQRELVTAANRQMLGRRLTVLVDGIDNRGRCVGRHCGQAPDVDSVCFLSEQRGAGKFVSCEVDGWAGYDLIVKPV